VRLCDEQGSEFARALINYSSHEVDKVKASRVESIDLLMNLSTRVCCARTSAPSLWSMGARTRVRPRGNPRLANKLICLAHPRLGCRA